MVSLAGDASNRRYFRLHLKGGLVPSLILMQLADPEGFKVSEEAVSRAATEVTELPFLNVLRPLSKAGVSVPKLHFYDDVAGLLYLEDFGDLTLFQACVEGGDPVVDPHGHDQPPPDPVTHPRLHTVQDGNSRPDYAQRQTARE